MGLKVSSKRFVLSDQTRNLYKFITLTAGIDLSAFIDNPVMLYNHDYEKLIGQWVDYRVEGLNLTAAPGFDEDDPFAMQQYGKVEAGILRGASIGISPLKFNELTGEMVSCLLLEASLTPIPNNKNALAIYNAKGMKLNADEITKYLLSVERTDPTIINNQKMNEKTIKALVALSVLAGLTITLSADSKDEDFESAIKKVGEKLSSLETEKVNLSTKVTNLEKSQNDAADKALDDLLAEAVSEKLLTAADVPSWKEFGKVNLAAMQKNLKSLKPVTLVELPADKNKKDTDTAGRETWGFDEFALNAPQELEAMEVADPDKFKILLSAKLEKARSAYSIQA